MTIHKANRQHQQSPGLPWGFRFTVQVCCWCNVRSKSGLPRKRWPCTHQATAHSITALGSSSMWERGFVEEKQLSKPKNPCPVTLTREHKHRTAQLLIRTLKNPRQICKVITGIELLTHLRAFFPLRQFKQHASSRKDVMRSGSDNAHQIKCVVKGKCSNQKENQTEFWAEWQRQQLLFLYVHKAALRILCMTWGLDDMERMIRQLFLLNLKN